MFSLLKIPLLNRETLQNYVGLVNFQKGEHYVDRQAISQGKLKNQVLTAFCQGHEFHPYRVGVIFDAADIRLSYCSCPVGVKGKCKHVAALLLAWIDKPEIFAYWDSLKSDLQAYDTSTLLELIDLLDEHADRSFDVIQAFSQNLQMVKSPRLARYMRRIEEAFHVSELQWYHPDEGGLTEITFALDKIRSDAEQLLNEEHWEEAIRIDQSLIQQILNHLDGHTDPWGNLTDEIKRCIYSLDKALQHLDQSSELRQKVFQLLFRLIEEQLYRIMPIGAEEAKQVILQHIHSVEREQMVAWIEALQMRRLPGEEHQQLGLEDFLIDLQKESLDPEVYLAHYRQTAQVLKLVDSLLELGKVKEAEQTAQQKEFVHQTLALAHLFVKHHQEDIAEKLVVSFSRNSFDLSSARWLKDFYQKRGDLKKTLKQAKHILYLLPRLNYYQEVQELAQTLQCWPTLRKEIFQHFEHHQENILLIEIHLEEKEIDQAIALFERSPPHSLKEMSVLLLVLRLAAAARSKYPNFSLKIYQEITENLIEERKRESYRQACDYLKIIKSIYEDLQQVKEWEIYLSNLLQTYRRLKALKEEINSVI